MKPTFTQHRQLSILEPILSDRLNPKHELCILSQRIDWEFLNKKLSVYFDEKWGARAKPVRLVVGLLILQSWYDFSDRQVVKMWAENPYWQVFCGSDFLEMSCPVSASSFCRWRLRLGEEGMEVILKMTIDLARKNKLVSRASLKKVIVDTTVMPKNITYPTDAKLYYRALTTLVRHAR